MLKYGLLGLLFISPLVAADDKNFSEAKLSADWDEASLTGVQRKTLAKAQEPVVKQALSSCLNHSNPLPPPFVVVVELDGSGAVTRAWRSDDSDAAKCFQAVAAKAKLMPPPHAPFYSSFEMEPSAL